MNAQTHNTPILELRKPKYGVTEQKKQELDNLQQQVLDAQYEVEQLTAIENSLTDKSNTLKQELAVADANKVQALNNKNLMLDVEENIKDLKNNSDVTFNKGVLADSGVKKVASHITLTIDKLIYSAEIINKLANLVTKKKGINPLISDELVAMVATAGTDANNAVALTLTALQSVFAAQASSLESEAAIALEMLQATKLYEIFIGEEIDGIVADDAKLPVENGKNNSIKALLERAYAIYSEIYDNTLKASDDSTKQLNDIKRKLSNAQIKLASLEAGYNAANAAALAS